jgi:hypothetical protein
LTNSGVLFRLSDTVNVPASGSDTPNMFRSDDEGGSYAGHFVYKQRPNPEHQPCFEIIIDKNGVDKNGVPVYKVIGNGYNYCDASPRQVERSFEYIY